MNVYFGLTSTTSIQAKLQIPASHSTNAPIMASVDEITFSSRNHRPPATVWANPKEHEADLAQRILAVEPADPDAKFKLGGYALEAKFNGFDDLMEIAVERSRSARPGKRAHRVVSFGPERIELSDLVIKGRAVTSDALAVEKPSAEDLENKRKAQSLVTSSMDTQYPQKRQQRAKEALELIERISRLDMDVEKGRALILLGSTLGFTDEAEETILAGFELIGRRISNANKFEILGYSQLIEISIKQKDKDKAQAYLAELQQLPRVNRETLPDLRDRISAL